MKKLIKMSVAMAAVAGIGYLAYKGLKHLNDEAKCCGYCDCEGDGYMGACECDCDCSCECHTDKAEKSADETVETVVEEKVAPAAEDKVDEEKPAEANAEAEA